MTGVSVLATILCIAAGIFEWVVLGNASWCGLFYFSDADFHDDYNSTKSDDCKEQLFAAMSFVTAAFWAASSICSLIFVQSGRYAKWEAKWDETFPEDDKEVAAVAVELGVVRESSEAAASEGVATNAVATSLEAAAVVVGVEGLEKGLQPCNVLVLPADLLFHHQVVIQKGTLDGRLADDACDNV